jgi:hypothetical protein
MDDALNPIVVKELRQAVQSRFVVAVLLLFLLLQLVFMGIYLVVSGISGELYSTEFQAGNEVFMLLQGILLTTCMLFVPAYTAFRLAAERSEVNVDLFFITALRPRSIIWGKFVAALVLALLIFSACTPFMTFTYFLRGIDIPSIFFVITLDFVVVAATVMLCIFLAVVPANRVLKSLLGILGFIILVYAFIGTLMGSFEFLRMGLAGLMESKEFWIACMAALLGFVSFIGLYFTWSVALLSPPSANRALPMRLWLLVLWLGGGAIMILCSSQIGGEEPFMTWIIVMGVLLCLGLVIAINEREQWAPRVARTIPRRWWLRPFAFLTYSGAAGGILLSCLLFGLIGLIIPVVRDNLVPVRLRGPSGSTRDMIHNVFQTMAILFLYVYSYAMTAVLLRSYLLKAAMHAVYTWVLFMVLLAAGMAIPYLLLFLSGSGGTLETHYMWLLTNPEPAMEAVALDRSYASAFYDFIFIWAGVVTVLSVPWFAKQMRRFRPFTGSGISVKEVPAVVLATSMETTRIER